MLNISAKLGKALSPLNETTVTNNSLYMYDLAHVTNIPVNFKLDQMRNYIFIFG